MSDMINQGCDVFHRYPYLVNRIKFPLSCIPTIFTGATFIVQLFLLAALFIVYFLCGQGLSIYLLQLPVILLLMFLFWDIFSLLLSLLSGLSKDVANLMKALGTPIFWLSGVIFDVSKIPIGWLQALLDFNPVTFFAVAYRNTFYNHMWFWEDTSMCIGFAIVFVVTLLAALLAYSRLHEEVPDVL